MGVVGGILLICLVGFYVFLAALLRVAGRADDRLQELSRELGPWVEGEEGGPQERIG